MVLKYFGFGQSVCNMPFWSSWLKIVLNIEQLLLALFCYLSIYQQHLEKNISKEWPISVLKVM